MSIIPEIIWAKPDETLAYDACLVSAGAVCRERYFHVVFRDSVAELSLPISALEMFTLVVSIKLWVSDLLNQSIWKFNSQNSMNFVMNMTVYLCL